MNVKKIVKVLTITTAAATPAVYFFMLLGKTANEKRGLEAALSYYKVKTSQMLNMMEEDAPEAFARFVNTLYEDDQFMTIMENIKLDDTTFGGTNGS